MIDIKDVTFEEMFNMPYNWCLKIAGLRENDLTKRGLVCALKNGSRYGRDALSSSVPGFRYIRKTELIQICRTIAKLSVQ